MFLNFIGNGSALNTVLGNNSAYIKQGESLLLIDCGSTTFSGLQRSKLLEGTKNIYVLITHRHPDHIASLGDLIFYVRYILKAEISILTPDEDNVVRLLELMGVTNELYVRIKLAEEFRLCNVDFDIHVGTIPVQHVEDMDCYGYVLTYLNTKVYYSGDAKTIPNKILAALQSGQLDYIYQDTCSYDYPDNPHMYIGQLYDLIKEKDRNKVFCMHFDEGFDYDYVQNMGFRLVSSFTGLY